MQSGGLTEAGYPFQHHSDFLIKDGKILEGDYHSDRARTLLVFHTSKHS